MGAPSEVLELVERYGRNRDVYRHGPYKEAELRTEFLDPFFPPVGDHNVQDVGLAQTILDRCNPPIIE